MKFGNVKTLWFCIVGSILFGNLPSASAQIPSLSSEEAEKLVVEKSEPVYPPLARQARIQGSVVAEVTVSDAGSITSAKLITGHPLLAQAALEAVQKRRFSPYITNGRATGFVTRVVISFSLGGSDAEVDEQLKRNREYTRLSDQCYAYISSLNWKEAEGVCKAAAALAEPPGSKRLVYGWVGASLLGQHRFQEALEYYSQAFELAQQTLTDKNAEFAYAYRDLGMAYQGLQNLEKARSLYKEAEGILRKARESIVSDFLKEQYQKVLRATLELHIIAAQQSGATDEVSELQKQLKAEQ